MIKILEVKHEIGQPLSVRTRALGTVVPGSNPNVKPIFVAKGSVSPPEDCDDHNRYFVDLVLNRTPGMKVITRPFPSVQKQWVMLTDVFRMPKEITANLEYDFKRQPANPRMEKTGDGSGIEHLTFDTVPWDTQTDAERAQRYFKDWRDLGRCLKNLDDWADWEDYFTCKVAFERLREKLKLERMPIQITVEGSCGILKRVFVRAYVQEAWGLRRTYSYAEVGNILESFDCPVSPHDLKNGNKGELIDNMVPRTPRTEDLLKRLELAFEGLDTSKIFILE